jgi:hypothetical protein
MELYEFISRPPGYGCLPGYELIKNQFVSKLSGKQHLALAVHRGWGKGILMREVGFALLADEKQTCLVYVDLGTIYDLPGFLSTYTLSIIKSVNWKGPVPIPQSELIQVLNLPESIARIMKLRLVIIISNFQQLGKIIDSKQILGTMKHIWSMQNHCTYCVTGSNVPFFRSTTVQMGSPMYRFFRIYFPQRIHTDTFIPYIRGLFLNGGKYIEDGAARKIMVLSDYHLFYLHLLSWNAFKSSGQYCTPEIVQHAFDQLLIQYRIYMEQNLNSLTTRQFNFLRAALETRKGINSEASRNHFRLGTSSTIARVKQSLEEKEIIQVYRGGFNFLDPLFESWLRRKVLHEPDPRP